MPDNEGAESLVHLQVNLDNYFEFLRLTFFVSEPLAIATPEPSRTEEDAEESVFSDDDCCEYSIEATEDDFDHDEEESGKRFVKQPPSMQRFIGKKF